MTSDPVPERLHVIATPRSRRARVEEDTGPEGERLFRVHVTEVAENGKANKAIIAALAKHLGVRKSALRLQRGETARQKTILYEP